MTVNSEIQTRTRTRTRPRRISSSCYRHPTEPVAGFCASCLRERLAGLDSSPDPASSSSLAATSILASLNNVAAGGTSSSISELRRSKSISVSKCEDFAGTSLSQPRRKSCDVRSRPRTLAHLFNLDDEKNGVNGESKVESRNLGVLSGIGEAVVEAKNEEIEPSFAGLRWDANVEDEVELEGDVKTMKEHIDLEWQSRKQKVRDFRDIAGGFWTAASVFSKKLRERRQNQKRKQHRGGGSIGCGGNDPMGAGKLIGRHLRGTQSEVGEYGFGRRSCDTEPRFSTDAGRLSIDDSRRSFDEPRASWDGYLIGRTIPRLAPMLSVVENGILPPINRPDNNNKTSVHGQMQSINEDEMTSGWQSGHENSDSWSSQKPSSFDRSSSVRSSSRKTSGLGADDLKLISNAKVSPTKLDILPGTKLVITEKELKDWHLSSLTEDNSVKFESLSNMDIAPSVGNEGNTDGFKKSTGRWRKMCNVLGWKYKISSNKCEDYTGKVVDPLVEACEKQGLESNSVINGECAAKLVRSSSCVSSRNSIDLIGSGLGPKDVAEMRGCTKKGGVEFVLERNKSARYAGTSLDTGLVPFYMTPLRSSKRGVSGKRSHIL